MDLSAFVRQFFFGFPGQKYRQQQQTSNREEPENDEDGIEDGRPLFDDLGRAFADVFQEIPRSMEDIADVFQEMQRSMEGIVRTFGALDFDRSPDRNEHPSSLADQMLKPGYSRHDQDETLEDSRIKIDQDLDPKVIPKEHFDRLFSGGRSMYPDNFQSNFRFSSSSVSIVDGAKTEKRVETDREGCRRQLTTHQFDGKKYTIEKRTCPGGAETTREHLENLVEEELPEFLKRFGV